MGEMSVIAICRWWVEELRVGMGSWLLCRGVVVGDGRDGGSGPNWILK
jgi:hypothetical protein